MKFADLHLHTTASDGYDTLDTRLRDAKSKGISCVAVTDHDTLHPSLDQPVQYIEDVEVISGSEIEVEIEGFKIDLLAYFVHRGDNEFSELVDDIYERRVERMKEMVDRVNEMIDSRIFFEEVRDIADNVLVRPHLGKVLVEKGEAEDLDGAYDKFISSENHAYVPLDVIGSEELIDMIHRCGGVVSLAHPGRSIPKKDFPRILGKLVDQGLDAIEAEYYYRGFDISEEIFFGNYLARKYALEHNLVITGGSDCHGSSSDHYTLGKKRLFYGYVRELKKRWEEVKEET